MIKARQCLMGLLFRGGGGAEVGGSHGAGKPQRGEKVESLLPNL